MDDRWPYQRNYTVFGTQKGRGKLIALTKGLLLSHEIQNDGLRIIRVKIC